jgi:nitrate reductase NapD
MNEYNVCGVLVLARPGGGAAVRARLLDIPGIDVHAVERDRLVLTVEDTAERRCIDTLSDLNHVDGVLSAAIVYQHTETEEPQQESAP